MGFAATGFFIAFVFLVVGCFLDAIPAIIICAPILEPLAKGVPMDPVHFAMIGIVSLAFGLVTPPYGLCLMISCAVAGIRIRDAIKDTVIMLMPMLMVLALVIVWPKVSLFLPGPDLAGVPALARKLGICRVGVSPEVSHAHRQWNSDLSCRSGNPRGTFLRFRRSGRFNLL